MLSSLLPDLYTAAEPLWQARRIRLLRCGGE